MRIHLVVTTLAALALAPACGDDGSSTPAVDAAPGIDANPDDINGCTRATANDLTAAGATRTIATVGLSYAPRCVRIKAGQSVTWSSDFQVHPLQGGTVADGPQAASPIGLTSSGTTKVIAFPTAGVYGYYCVVHTTLMMRAIYVQP